MIDWENVTHPNIKKLSIDKFYEMVTWVPTAFRDLCLVLPRVLDDVIQEVEERVAWNTVFQELSEISPDILKSLYLMSFQRYEGFDDFNI